MRYLKRPKSSEKVKSSKLKMQSYPLRREASSSKLKVSTIFVHFALLTAILHFALLTFNLSEAKALTMSNSNYILQWGNLNTAAGTPTSADYKLGVTVGQIAPGLFSGDNYKVRSGFQYIHSIIKFRFSITETLVDFGVIEPGTPVLRTHSLIVSNGSAYGYSVYATESAQLRVPSLGAIIPDTTCDNGSCTESTSAEWSSALTYGFGYRCDNETGTDCASGFSTDFYKQFADSSLNETGQAVMTGTNVGKNKRVRITYKVNISNVQPAGLYHNIVTYVATPTF